MRLLLDTHAFLWFIGGDAQLSAAARSAIEDAGNEKFLSAASVWEMAIKVSLKKLQLVEPFDVLVPREIGGNGFLYLPIEVPHTVAVTGMPFHHRDPFDRMLAAQALTESMAFLSADPAFDAYGVNRIW